MKGSLIKSSMKIIAALCLTVLLFSACHNIQDNNAKQGVITAAIKKDSNSVNSPFDTIGLFSKLYPKGKIVHKKTDEKNFRVLVSNGEDCFINVDTIIKIPGNGNDKYAIVFTAFDYTDDGERNDSHASNAIYDIALVNNGTGFCNIENFCKNFDTTSGWGLGGVIALENFGKEEVLHISAGYGVEGEVYTDDNYYAIDSAYLGKPVLAFNSIYSNAGNFEFDSASGILKSDMVEPLSNYKVQERKLMVIPSSSGQWDDLKLSCKFTRYDSINHKMNDSVFVENYQINASRNKYERVKK
jgi:hypothetical protein